MPMSNSALVQKRLLRLWLARRVCGYAAAAVLRHYPGKNDMDQLALLAPHVVQERMEPLHRMLAAYTVSDLEETVFQQQHGNPP